MPIVTPPGEDSEVKKGIAVVTGASSGLGKIYAHRLAQRGYELLLVARREERLQEIAKALTGAYGVAVTTFVADLGNPEDIEKVVGIVAGDENITMLVNNAGTSTLAFVGQTEVPQLAAMINVNVTALARLSQVAIASFKRRDRGVLINIGSVLGFHTFPISSIYSGTKSYVNLFTRGLQEEVAGTNVIVQLVLPAATATDIWENSGVPLSQLDQTTIMSAEECVDAALAGLDQGELMTMPSVEDAQLLANYESARAALFEGAQRGKPASRYQVAAAGHTV